MKQVVVALIVALSVSVFPAVGYGVENDLIGLYLDEQATVVCQQQGLHFPYFCTAYLIAKNLSSADGIKAWECSIEGSEDVIVSTVRYNGEVINVESLPYFMVGQSSALPASGLVKLAEVDLVFTGPGSVWLGPTRIPSIQSSSSPIVLREDETEGTYLMELSNEYGGGVAPVLVVGKKLICPESTFSAAGIEREEFDPLALEAVDDSCYWNHGEPKSDLYEWSGHGEPWSVAYSDSGYVFVTDPASSTVRRYSIYGEYQAGITLEEGYDTPKYVVADDERSKIYVRSNNDPAVLVYSFEGAFIDSIGGYPFGSEVGQFEVGSKGPIALDSAGNLYVVDIHRIQKFTPDGNSAGVIVSPGVTYGEPGVWWQAGDLDVDQEGRIFLLDQANGIMGIYPKVFVFSSTGAFITDWGGYYRNPDNTFKPGGLYNPQAMKVTYAGKVYISDATDGNANYGIQAHEWDGELIDEWMVGESSSMEWFDIIDNEPNFLAVASYAATSVHATLSVYGRDLAFVNAMNSGYQGEDFSLLSDVPTLAACPDTSLLAAGVAADGVASLLLLQDFPAPFSVDVAVSDPVYPTLLSSLGVLSTIDGASDGDHIGLSTASYDGRNILMAYYTSPIDFVRPEVSTDVQDMSRHLELTYDFGSMGIPATTGYSADLVLERPPVVFVHGFLGNSKQFDNYLGIIDDGKWDDRRSRLDYSFTHGESLAVNCVALARHIDSRRGRYFAEDGIVVGQFDLVAHSMGGVILRYYAQSGDGASGDGSYRYLYADNLGRGDFHKILFHNTPHAGTPLARSIEALVESLYPQPGDDTIHKQKRADNRALIELLLKWRNLSLSSLDGPALRQLRDDSPEILGLGELNVPSYGVGGMGANGLESYPLRRALWGLTTLIGEYAELPGIVELTSQFHDGFVPLPSQLGGFNSSARYIAEGWSGLHESLFRKPTYTGWLSDYTRDITTAWATRSAFSDSMQQVIPATSSLGQKSILASAVSTQADNLDLFPDVVRDAFDISFTVNSVPVSAVLPGQEIVVRGQSATSVDVDTMYVDVNGDVLILTSPDFEMQYVVPENLVGALDAGGIAAIGSGVVGFGRGATVNVDLSGVSLLGIRCRENAFGMKMLGGLERIAVVGDYSDGIFRDLSRYNTTYTSSNPSVAEVYSDGTIVAVGAGAATIVVSNTGFEVNCTVQVENGGVINNRPEANAGGPYSYCTNREVCFDGRSSYDYDEARGDVLSYEWDLNGDGIYGDMSGEYVCVNMDIDTFDHLVGLRVTDSGGKIAHDFAIVRPDAAGCEDAPVKCQYVPSAPDTTSGLAASPGGFIYLRDVVVSPYGVVVRRLDSACTVDGSFQVLDNSIPEDIEIRPTGTGEELCFVVGASIARYDSVGNSLAAIALPADREGYANSLEIDGNGNFYVAAEQSGGQWTVDRIGPDGTRALSWNLIGEYGNQPFAVSASGDLYCMGGSGIVEKVIDNGGSYELDTSWANSGSLEVPVGSVSSQNLTVSPSGDLYFAGAVNGVSKVFRVGLDGLDLDARSGHSGRSLEEVVAISVDVDGCVAVSERSSTGDPLGVTVITFGDYVSGILGDGTTDEREAISATRVWLALPGVVSGQMQSEIKYSTGASGGPVELQVFDLRGCLVKTLVDEVVAAGAHSIHWDQRNRSGMRVASGVYLVRLKAGGQLSTGKMIVVR